MGSALKSAVSLARCRSGDLPVLVMLADGTDTRYRPLVSCGRPGTAKPTQGHTVCWRPVCGETARKALSI